jgi:undecaprenyl-diphosphatase
MEALLAWDERAFLAINNGLGTPALDEVMRSLSYIGEGLPLAVILLCCAFIGDRTGVKARIAFLAGGVLSGAIAVHIAKIAVARPRPIPAFAERVKQGAVAVRVVGAPPRGHTSWPSGHSQGAFGAALVLGELFRRLRWPLLAAAALVALSRVYVGAHFPLDVLSGAIVGAAAAGAAIAVRRRRLARIRAG